MSDKKTIGIIAGFNPRAAQEIKARLLAQPEDIDVILTQDQFQCSDDPTFALSDRKIFVFNETQLLDEMGADLVLVPDFKSGDFINEVQTEVQIKVLDIKSALLSQMGENTPALGILSVENAAHCVNGTCELSQSLKLIFPDEADNLALAQAREQIRQEGLTTQTYQCIKSVAQKLLDKGAQLIVPNCSNFALAQEALTQDGLPVLDVFDAFVKAALTTPATRLPKPFKLGLIGGLGPAATVDLFDKIVKATPATYDQEHFKLVIEENPQIPDRTACLLDGGADPTLAMYNCAKRLQNDGCDAILIPCNTAHAFLPRLLRGLTVPFIDMQETMLNHIKERFGEDARIGLLGTTGTMRTGIYSQKAEKLGLKIFTPEPQYQERVMSAIYGPKGAKAGYTDGVCYDDLYAAAEHLVSRYDCNVLILGCTELPLIFHECDDFKCAGKTVAIVDPTATLARKAVEVAIATNKERGTR